MRGFYLISQHRAGTISTKHIFKINCLSTILYVASRSRSQLLRREHQQNNKRLPSVGNKTFAETMIESLNGEKPGHRTTYSYGKKEVLRSLANDRARQGFRYWVLDKPVHNGQLIFVDVEQYYY